MFKTMETIKHIKLQKIIEMEYQPALYWRLELSE